MEKNRNRANIFFARIIIIVLAITFVAIVILAVLFGLPPKARAGEALRYHNQGISYLCDENAELAEVADEQFGINRVSVAEDIVVLPPSHFFRLIKEKAVGGRNDKDAEEVLQELIKDGVRLKMVLKKEIFRAERIK
ncbi:hypothetical protein GW814_01140 [Candidatus Falkowbacteria bacterium]|nr:hypothetical protein [Candidatus Falkowbacteria bacterium]OIP79907.1 MAG: hypothetical protein AUK20_01750 [Parcubacteria group bacterium CG2_30_45_37]